MEEKYKHRIFTIPNLLSMFRLLLIPVIIWLYVEKNSRGWATGILILSGVTDVVDGIIARKFGMISDFGKALDPIADKLTQIAVLFCLVTRFSYMLLPLILLMVKELAAGVLGLIVIRRTGQVYGSVWHGKVNTVLLYATMILHFLWPEIPMWLSCILTGTCTGMLLLSAVLYTRRYLQLL